MAAETRQLVRSLASRRFQVSALLMASLGVDWYYHDSEQQSLDSMKARMRLCQVPPIAETMMKPPPPSLSTMLAVPGHPLNLGVKPVLVLAPSGAGKSTKLAQLARDYAQPKPQLVQPPVPPSPVVLIRLGDACCSSSSMSDPAKEEGLDPASRLGSIAARFYEQTGFPGRRSFIGWLLELASSRPHPDALRLAQALRLLFKASREVFLERLAQGIPHDEAKVKLLFDDVSELIRDSNTGAAGGRYVLHCLAGCLVKYCIDTQSVHAVMAASSASLADEFARGVLIRSRLQLHRLHDPTEQTVLQALAEHGYSEAQARRIFDVCGTRFCVLEKALNNGRTSAADVDQFLEGVMDAAHEDVQRLLSDVAKHLGSGEMLKFQAQLDKVLSGGSGWEAVRSVMVDDRLKQLPSFTATMWFDQRFQLQFQSRLHELAWEAAAKKMRVEEPPLA